MLQNMVKGGNWLKVNNVDVPSYQPKLKILNDSNVTNFNVLLLICKNICMFNIVHILAQF